MTFIKFFNTLRNIILVLSLITVQIAAQDLKPKRIIYETDMCLDVDDVGALAILHALANNGETEILAVCFNEEHINGAGAIDAINTWYGRGDIPVGVYKGDLDNDWSSNSSYLSYLDRNFPNDIDKGSADSALTVYRQILSQQPDSSVTIVSVGFLNNLNDLLLAEPELIKKKVVELVQMAGVNNDGFNFVMHNLVNVSQNVLENWPTPIVISQAGGDIYTGDNLSTAPIESPVRWAYYKWFGDHFESRSSWDQMAVLYGVRGLSPYFNEITTGTGSLSNGYVWQMEPGFRSYLSTRNPNSTYVRIIEDLMDQLPIGARFELSAKNGWLPFSVELDASISNVGGNSTIQEYLWDFGDGTSGTGETVTHEYTSTGIFDIQLTIINDLGDSLKAFEQIQVSDPIFSPVPYFGDVTNYIRNQEELWSTRIDSEEVRLYLSNDTRNAEIPLSGYSFVKDSIYADFTMNLAVCSGEDLDQNSLADYSILFGFTDDKNYNRILMKQSTSTLVNITNGQVTTITWSSQKGIPDDHFHELALNLSGDKLTVTLDDSSFLSASSSRLEKQGKIGFGSGKYAVFFDNISISSHGTATNLHKVFQVPGKLLLGQNYPNPFNPSTRISFTLTRPENVKIEVYNLLGQIVETLLDKPMSAGNHEITFTAQNINSGVYLYKIEVGKFRDLKKMILLK